MQQLAVCSEGPEDAGSLHVHACGQEERRCLYGDACVQGTRGYACPLEPEPLIVMFAICGWGCVIRGVAA